MEHTAPPHFPPEWTALPRRPAPGPGEAVLVVAPLDVSSERLEGLRATFAPREEERFRSFATDTLAQVEVGVDVELPRPRRTDAIARRFYAPGEIERLFAIEDAAARADAFFRLWTCKEAFLKVTGEGLSRSTRSYEIAPDRSRVLWATGILDAAVRYSVYPLEIGDPYRAAMVAEGRVGLRRHRWE
jgi:hypothetical protein